MDIFIFGFLFFKKEKNRSFSGGKRGVPLVVCNQKSLFKDFLFDG
jgi:hypothetical protein